MNEASHKYPPSEESAAPVQQMQVVVPVATPLDRRLKFLFFPLTWVLAHVGRCVEIAKELQAQGHEVVFAGADEAHPGSRLGHAAKAGFRTIRVKEPDWPWAWERFERHGGWSSFIDFLQHNRWAPLEEIIEDIIRVTREEAPDLILGDASVGVTTAGHVTGVPAAGVLNAYNTHFFRPWSKYRVLIRAMDMVAWAPQRKRVYKRYGVKNIAQFDLMRANPLLSPDLQAFHAPHGDFPNWTAIGPLISEPPFPLPDWYAELDDGRKNVYITMGSTGMLEGLLTRCYEALGKSEYRFIVTTAGQMSEAAMAAAPDNFRFAKYAPGSKLLDHCEAVVLHGGNGTMYQALAAGLPMVALPSHLEQQVCTKILVEKGFGIRRSVRRISGPELVKAIDTVVRDPSYRGSAAQHQAAVREANAPARAAEILTAHALNRKNVGVL